MLRTALPAAVVVGFLAVGVFVPAPATGGDPNVIKVMSSMPRSGSAKGQTDTIVNGIRLAFNETKANPNDPGERYTVTTGGKTYTLEFEDLDDATAAAGQWTAEQETSNADKARLDPDVMAYIGTYNSGAAKVSMPILNKAHLFMVSPANTYPGLTKQNMGERDEPKRYQPTGTLNFTRVVPADDVQGPAAAEWTKELGCKRVYILDDNELYGKGIADLYEAHARKIGLDVLGHESIDFKAQEFASLMTKIRRKGPDLIYFGGTTQTKAGQLLKDMVKAGMGGCKMMGPDGCQEDAMIDSAGADNANGRFYATFGGLPPERLTGKGATFVANYTKLYGKPPSEAYAVYGYECGLVALEAIRAAGAKDREKVRAAGLAIKDFDGATGKWSFDENGDTTLKLMSGSIVEGGQFKFQRTLTVGKK